MGQAQGQFRNVSGMRMKFPEKIAWIDISKFCDLFKAFIEHESVPRWENGLPVIEERKITAELIEASLGVSVSEAKSIHKTLVVEEWILADRLVPSRKAMALAQHVDRPPLPREIALAILDRVLDWADRVN